MISTPDFHIVKYAVAATFQLKICEVQHDLTVDLDYNSEDALAAVGVVVGVVG